MSKKTVTPAIFTLDLEKSVAVEHVGMTDRFAWIRFSNGMRFDLSRAQLLAIIAGYERSLKAEEIFAQLAEETGAEFPPARK